MFSNGRLDLSANVLIGHVVFVWNIKLSPIASHLKDLCFFSNFAVKVHKSQAYRNMEMTRERISFTFYPRDTLLSLQMGFIFVRAAGACAILERISDLEPLSETTAQRYLKLVTVPNFCPFTFISLWMPLALFVIRLVFSALNRQLYLVQVLVKWLKYPTHDFHLGSYSNIKLI